MKWGIEIRIWLACLESRGGSPFLNSSQASTVPPREFGLSVTPDLWSCLEKSRMVSEVLQAHHMRMERSIWVLQMVILPLRAERILDNRAAIHRGPCRSAKNMSHQIIFHLLPSQPMLPTEISLVGCGNAVDVHQQSLWQSQIY